jgi:ComF family protein
MRSRVLAEIVALVAPPVCLACREPVGADVEGLCGACRRALPWLPTPRCPRCGLPAPCGPCPARGAAWSAAWAPLEHSGPARALVTSLKFAGALAVADLMAAQIAAGAPEWLGSAGPLVPVPAHPARRRRRGFDQAECLARALASRTGLSLVDCLSRHGPPDRQLGASRRRRIAPGRVDVEATTRAPLTAVLVDDVHTTGATLDACARALLQNGAGSVRCLTYTRTLRA